VILTTSMAAIWTQADIDNLKAAVREGVLSVTYAGPPERIVQYQSLGAMRALLAEMVRQVQKPTAFRRATFNKGFDPSDSGR
jgi:hypothetical protein